MNNLVNSTTEIFDSYISTFKKLTEEQEKNFSIKREHSVRVANICVNLAEKLGRNKEEQKIAFTIGLFHDIGRFLQLIEFNTFHDSKSVDHAEYSVKVLNENGFLNALSTDNKNLILLAIQYHNKFKLPEKLTEEEMFYSKLIRDADKLDILNVLTEYYSYKTIPNHTLTWELPKGNTVSPNVAKEILSGFLVSKNNVETQMDIKIMQMSWVYDLNFRSSFEFLLKNRFLEKIYNTLPKTDLVIDIHRKVKVFSENKLFSKEAV